MLQIENALIAKGYKGYKIDRNYKGIRYVEMTGGKDEYFSNLGHVDFVYIKGDVEFAVGIHEKGSPPNLKGSNKKLNGFKIHSMTPSVISRILDRFGCEKVIEAVELQEHLPCDIEAMIEEELTVK